MAANGETDDCPGIEAETAFEVRLYIYDLSKELSKSFKKILKGKPLPGIWHTGLVAYGREYYFASSGIESCRPGETILGEPDQILTLGKTELPYSVFLEYIFALGESSYRPGTYNLLEHNCNSFSQEVSSFLTGGPIPDELKDVPQEILGNKNLSHTLKEYFDKLSLRVEGSKGLSFGALTNAGRRAIDLPPTTVNGDIITNGHSSPQVINSNSNNTDAANPPTENQQKSSETSRKTEKSSNMPSVNGELQTSSLPGSTPTSDATDVTGKQPAGDAAAASQPVVDGAEQKPPETANRESGEVTQTPDAKPQPPAASSAVDGSATSEASAPASVAPADAAGRQQTAVADAAGEEAQIPPSGDTQRRESSDDTSIPTYTSRRSKKYQDPPILYENVDGLGCHKKLLDVLGDRLGVEEKQAMGEILEYLTSEGGAWALGTPHLDTIGRLLNDRNLPGEVPILMLHVLQAAALKEDVILLLHQDRKDHHIMSYLYRIENLPHDEQEEVASLMCNLCSNNSSFDWLMYISEWEEDGHSCNNSKVTVRVAVHSLLCDRSTMQEKGSALVYNLALKELFDDTATELAMAVLQFLQADINEELAFRNLTALLRFLYISYNDVPALMKMLGPDVRKFNGKSERVDELVEQIEFKLSVSISA